MGGEYPSIILTPVAEMCSYEGNVSFSSTALPPVMSFSKMLQDGVGNGTSMSGIGVHFPTLLEPDYEVVDERTAVEVRSNTRSFYISI